MACALELALAGRPGHATRGYLPKQNLIERCTSPTERFPQKRVQQKQHMVFAIEVNTSVAKTE